MLLTIIILYGLDIEIGLIPLYTAFTKFLLHCTTLYIPSVYRLIDNLLLYYITMIIIISWREYILIESKCTMCMPQRKYLSLCWSLWLWICHRKKDDELARWCPNSGPTSRTLVQHWDIIGVKSSRELGQLSASRRFSRGWWRGLSPWASLWFVCSVSLPTCKSTPR